MSLLNACGLSFRYPSTDILFQNASFSVGPGDRVAIVGSNGSGKSTLLRLLSGELDPSAGEIARRRDAVIAAVDQQPTRDRGCPVLDFVLESKPAIASLRGELRELESRIAEPGAAEVYADSICEYEVAGGYGAEAEAVRSLSGLGFREAEFELPLDQLSGGQRTRAALARALLRGADLLLLDEPTNHRAFLRSLGVEASGIVLAPEPRARSG